MRLSSPERSGYFSSFSAWRMRAAAATALVTLVSFVGLLGLATPANATCTGCDARIDNVNPFYDGYRVSTAFDGTNNTIDLSAEVEQSISNLPRAGFVSFYYSTIDPGCTPYGQRTYITNVPIVAHADPSATTGWGYKFGGGIQWTPPGSGTYCIVFALEEVGTHAHLLHYKQVKNVVIDTSPSLALTQPALVAGWIPVYNSKANILGTASVNPMPTASAGFGNAAHSGLVFDESSLRWSSVMAAPAQFMPTPTANKFLPDYRSAHVENNAHDSRVWGTISTLYQQKLNSFGGTPAAAVRSIVSGSLPLNPTGIASTQRQRYSWVAKDQKGRTIPGLPVEVTFNDPNNNSSYCAYRVAASGQPSAAGFGGGGVTQCGTGSLASTNTVPQTILTDEFGRLRLDIMNLDVETVSMALRTHFAGGTFLAGRDRSDSATYSTTSGLPRQASITVEGHPKSLIYPTQTYSSPLGPTVTVHIDDGAGAPIVNQPVTVETTRTIISGQAAPDTNVYPAMLPTMTTPGTDSAGNVDIPLLPVPVQPSIVPASPTRDSRALSTDGEAGFDVVRTYVDLDGVSGFGTNDFLVGVAIIRFGPQRIFAVPCDSGIAGPPGAPDLPSSVCPATFPVSASGSSSTVTFVNTIYDGTQFVRVPQHPLTVTVTQFIPHSGSCTTSCAPTPFVGSPGSFGLIAGGGLVLSGPLSGTVTTDPSGVANVKVFSGAAQRFVLTASDPSLGLPTTSDDAIEVSRFVGPPILATASVLEAARLAPDAILHSVPGAPGQPLQISVRLADTTGKPIADQNVRLRVNAGYFVAPRSLQAAGPQAAGPQAAGPQAAEVSNASLGASIIGRTDSAGVLQTAVSIGRDPRFDDRGDILGAITVTMDKVTKTLAIGVGKAPKGVLFSTNFARDGGRSTEIAGDEPMSINSGAGNDHLSGHGGGDITAGKATSIDVRTFLIDSFGNYVREKVTVMDDALPTLAAVTRVGAYLKDSIGTDYRVTNAASGPDRRKEQTITFNWREHSFATTIHWS